MYLPAGDILPAAIVNLNRVNDVTSDCCSLPVPVGSICRGSVCTHHSFLCVGWVGTLPVGAYRNDRKIRFQKTNERNDIWKIT